MATRKVWFRWVGTLVVLATASASLAQTPGRTSLDNERDKKLKEAKTLGEKTVRLMADSKLSEAIDAMEQMVTIERDCFSASNPGRVAGSLDSLASLHETREDFPAARKAGEESLEIKRKLYGDSDWRTVDGRLALENINVLARLTPDERKDVAKAIELSRQAAKLRRNGKLQEAFPLAKECVAIRKRVLGEQVPAYAASLYNLADLFVAQGEYARALPLFRKAMEIRKNVLGERHPEYAQSLTGLAGLYHAQGDFARAEPLLREALNIYKKAQGERHTNYATSANNLGFLYYSKRDCWGCSGRSSRPAQDAWSPASGGSLMTQLSRSCSGSTRIDGNDT
jgi:tetratricopeptide (TPR) repeat protein